MRKDINVAARLECGDHLYFDNKKQARNIQCKNSYAPLPFGPQSVSEVEKRTQNAQAQEQALPTADLVLKPQKIAARRTSPDGL